MAWDSNSANYLKAWLDRRHSRNTRQGFRSTNNISPVKLPELVLSYLGPASGEPGACGSNTVERADGGTKELQGRNRIEMDTDDVFVIQTPEGGGYGRK